MTRTGRSTATSSPLPLPADADDVIQEVSVVLWRKYEELEPRTNFRAWANSVARNHLRAERRLRTRVVSSETITRVAATERGMSEVLELRRAFLTECIEELPLESRRLVRERYLEQRTPGDLADAVGSGLSTVYARLARIRKRLLACVSRKIDRSAAS